MTITQNLTIGQIKVLNRKPDKAIERGLKYLDRVGLIEQKDKFPGQLSGGQQQRVAIARALVLHPRLMLFDEPLSNLDAKLRIEMRAEIKQLHAKLGLTSIYVTHDQAEALSLSDRIIVLRDGLLMQAGTPQEIHDRPKNAFVADFMGFRNFFRVKLGAPSQGLVHGTHDGIALAARANGGAAGPEAVMAIRPEDIRVGRKDDGAATIRGRVELVEYLGRELEAAVRVNERTRIWLRTSDHVNLGDNVDLQFPVDKVVVLPVE